MNINSHSAQNFDGPGFAHIVRDSHGNDDGHYLNNVHITPLRLFPSITPNGYRSLVQASHHARNCSICLENINKGYRAFSCAGRIQHIYHTACVTEWIRAVQDAKNRNNNVNNHSVNCPDCRAILHAQVSQRQLVELWTINIYGECAGSKKDTISQLVKNILKLEIKPYESMHSNEKEALSNIYLLLAKLMSDQVVIELEGADESNTVYLLDKITVLLKSMMYHYQEQADQQLMTLMGNRKETRLVEFPSYINVKKLLGNLLVSSRDHGHSIKLSKERIAEFIIFHSARVNYETYPKDKLSDAIHIYIESLKNRLSKKTERTLDAKANIKLSTQQQIARLYYSDYLASNNSKSLQSAYSYLPEEFTVSNISNPNNAQLMNKDQIRNKLNELVRQGELRYKLPIEFLIEKVKKGPQKDEIKQYNQQQQTFLKEERLALLKDFIDLNSFEDSSHFKSILTGLYPLTPLSTPKEQEALAENLIELAQLLYPNDRLLLTTTNENLCDVAYFNAHFVQPNEISLDNLAKYNFTPETLKTSLDIGLTGNKGIIEVNRAYLLFLAFQLLETKEKLLNFIEHNHLLEGDLVGINKTGQRAYFDLKQSLSELLGKDIQDSRVIGQLLEKLNPEEVLKVKFTSIFDLEWFHLVDRSLLLAWSKGQNLKAPLDLESAHNREVVERCPKLSFTHLIEYNNSLRSSLLAIEINEMRTQHHSEFSNLRQRLEEETIKVGRLEQSLDSALNKMQDQARRLDELRVENGELRAHKNRRRKPIFRRIIG